MTIQLRFFFVKKLALLIYWFVAKPIDRPPCSGVVTAAERSAKSEQPQVAEFTAAFRLVNFKYSSSPSPNAPTTPYSLPPMHSEADQMKNGQSSYDPQVRTAAIAENSIHNATANRYISATKMRNIGWCSGPICPAGQHGHNANISSIRQTYPAD